jgi:hypothetical protein
MIQITTREIAALTKTEQRSMARWIGEWTGLSVLRAGAARRQAVAEAISEAEQDDVPDFPWDDEVQEQLEADNGS